MMAGKWLTGKKIYKAAAMFKSSSYSFEFYAPGIVRRLETRADVDEFTEKNRNSAIYTSAGNLKELDPHGYTYRVLGSFSDFHISMLTPKFLNPSTRQETLDKMVLITAIKKKQLSFLPVLTSVRDPGLKRNRTWY